jgi:hypothetical protein
MNELNKRIALDLLTAPGTVVPFTLGSSLLMLSVVLGAGWGLFGFGLMLLGLGMLGSNVLLNFEGISKQALESIQREQKEERGRRLDELDAVLSSNREPRDQQALRNMRTLYDEFVEDLSAGRISAIGTRSMFDQIDGLFNEVVKRLERQHQLWLTSRKLSGTTKENLIKQRDELLDEVERCIDNMTQVISEVRALGLKASKGELTALSDRLTRQLDVAKATDAALNDLDNDLKYSEYLKQ